MKITQTEFKGVLLITPETFQDNRGCFKETFNEQNFKDQKLPYKFVQDNQSLSKRGVIRGIHVQFGDSAQGKLIRVAYGRVLDIIVDLNKDSKTCGQYIAIELTNKNNLMIYIPEGYGHGFISLEENTIFCYKVTKPYSPSSETGIKWDDPDLNINWKLKENNIWTPIISQKDLNLPSFKEYKLGK